MKLRHSVVLLALGTLSRAWRATFTDANQCEDMTVSWSGTGGEKLGPPFVVRMVGFGLAPLTIDIPTTAWSDATQSGSYKFNVPWPAGTNFVTSMDDGFGTGTGGVTGIQTVNPSSNSSCITTAITQPEHVYDVYGTYIQCSVVTMNWTVPATSSTQINGLVPNGIAFRLDPPVTNSKSTTWNLNIPGGTAFVLMYTPPSGPGLASRLLVSQADGGSDECLSSGGYPSATASQTGVAQATSTASTSASVSPSSSASASSGATGNHTPNLGAIIGATLGAVAFLCALVALAFCLYRRKRRFTRVGVESPSPTKDMRLESKDGGSDDSHHHNATVHRNLPDGAVILPFVLPSVSSTQETPTSSTRKERFQPQTRGAPARQMSRETLTTAESSHGAPRTLSARRDQSETEDGEPVFVHHADAGFLPIQPHTREVIELPPNYDQLPRPLPQPGSSNQEGGRREFQRKV